MLGASMDQQALATLKTSPTVLSRTNPIQLLTPGLLQAHVMPHPGMLPQGPLIHSWVATDRASEPSSSLH
jgi:hypothetical protein